MLSGDGAMRMGRNISILLSFALFQEADDVMLCLQGEITPLQL